MKEKESNKKISFFNIAGSKASDVSDSIGADISVKKLHTQSAF